jgi:hypothetical protein
MERSKPMGYRSDVQIVFYLTNGCSESAEEFNAKQGTTTLPFAALKFWFEETYPVKEAKDEWEAEIRYDNDYILLKYTDVKWYPGYEHVMAVEAVFEKFSDAFRSNERDHRAQYEIVRVGEEDADIERECSDYADRRLFVVREIIFE